MTFLTFAIGYKIFDLVFLIVFAFAVCTGPR
jgi:hypothetical protein